MAYHSFRDFIEKIKDVSVIDARRIATEEYTQIKGARGKRADVLRRDGAMEYMHKLGAFLFFMQNGFSNLAEEDVKHLRPVLEKWIEKRQLLPNILNNISAKEI